MAEKIAVFVLALALGTASGSTVLAASVKCTVKAIEGTDITLDCGKKADTLRVAPG